MDFTVENICGLIIRSRLLTPEEVKAMYQRWQDETKPSAGGVPQFGKWLVARQYVTEYQAALLLKGHADDFFIGQYKIVDRLGKGRMAGVYKAIHRLGQVVAIKVLPPSRAREPQMLARFQREARLALKLKHPNVVRAFQLGESGDLHYLVMEYLEGDTFDEVLQRRSKLGPGEAVRIVHQALLGLQHIHEQGMVHRDLKPANLMLAPAAGGAAGASPLNATVKVVDIGLGRELFDETAAPAQRVTELTVEGILLGTPDYLAPEQARSPSGVDIRADIYSLGCVLYHALAGQPPFPDKSVLQQMIRHATEPPRPLKDFNRAVPDGLQQIVNWMLAKKPDQRYPTPERAAQALQVFLVAEEAPRAQEPPKMNKYLTWLEAGAKEDAKDEELVIPEAVSAPLPCPVGAPASPGALPVAQALPPPPLVAAPVSAPPIKPGAGKAGTPAPTKPAKASPVPPIRTAAAAPPPLSRDRKKVRRERPPTSEAPTLMTPMAPPFVFSSHSADDIDVELVPMDAPELVPAPSGGGFSRRHWLLLGFGVAAVVAAVLLGWALAVARQG